MSGSHQVPKGRLAGPGHLGAGKHGLALAADAGAILRALEATVADISDTEPAT